MRNLKNILLALVAIACCAASLMPPSQSDPSDYDLHLQWVASSNTNVTAYALYYGQHYPNWNARTVWFGTNAWITNAPLYHSEYWITALGGGGETTPSQIIPQENGYQFMKLTVTCTGTGTVYRAATTAGPWLRMLINFHGVVSTVTNPPEPSMLYEGPGMKIDRLLWNL